MITLDQTEKEELKKVEEQIRLLEEDLLKDISQVGKMALSDSIRVLEGNRDMILFYADPENFKEEPKIRQAYNVDFVDNGMCQWMVTVDEDEVKGNYTLASLSDLISWAAGANQVFGQFGSYAVKCSDGVYVYTYDLSKTCEGDELLEEYVEIDPDDIESELELRKDDESLVNMFFYKDKTPHDGSVSANTDHEES